MGYKEERRFTWGWFLAGAVFGPFGVAAAHLTTHDDEYQAGVCKRSSWWGWLAIIAVMVMFWIISGYDTTPTQVTHQKIEYEYQVPVYDQSLFDCEQEAHSVESLKSLYLMMLRNDMVTKQDFEDLMNALYHNYLAMGCDMATLEISNSSVS